MFKILRFFSAMSLICLLLAAAVLALFYRHSAVDLIVELGERGNRSLSQAALNSVRSQLIEYLEPQSRTRRISAELDEALQNIMRDTNVIRIKIYNRHGTVVFSTVPDQIGTPQKDNPGFSSAIRGSARDKLVYRDTFNWFDKEDEDQNLIQSYLPVRSSSTAPVVGVFEIYTDVSDLVERAERTQVLIAIAAIIVLVLLYVALLLIVRNAAKTIQGQQETIRERTETLELLSSQLLSAQENEKKRIANELHEGVAQSLSGVKMRLENTLDSITPHIAKEHVKLLEDSISVVQDAIRDVSTTAMSLRPSSLDDHGIAATIEELCRRTESIFPELRVHTRIDLNEDDVPSPLKIIVYRIVQDTLNDVTSSTQANEAHIELHQTATELMLLISNNDAGYYPKSGNRASLSGLAAMRERSVMSGGSFSVSIGERGPTLRAAWPLFRAKSERKGRAAHG